MDWNYNKMGRSEWGFLVKSKDDIIKIIELLRKHNNLENCDLRGEDLHFYSAIQFNGEYYLCVGNLGRRQPTSDFIESNYDGKVYYPFEKPSWWNDTEKYTYVWNYDPKISFEENVEKIYGIF
ncbi:MAG: hypothetical protein Satyrvirus23_3 [Satyrvirus sp.]|uniref:Uncharacterized protein n=1 Tax=Satyrvirus sp. TaxID=2487771 RepID=A0A3G5AEF1_9VIRU|nr:MAG: hypothetical protein Satyrvirus23_3 [Satyrvirus sp.]